MRSKLFFIAVLGLSGMTLAGCVGSGYSYTSPEPGTQRYHELNRSSYSAIGQPGRRR